MLEVNRKFYFNNSISGFVRDKSSEKCVKPLWKMLTLYKNIKNDLNKNYWSKCLIGSKIILQE